MNVSTPPVRPASPPRVELGSTHFEQQLDAHFKHAFPADTVARAHAEYRNTGFAQLKDGFYPKNLLPKAIADHHAVANSDPKKETPDVFHRAMILEDTETPRVYQATPERSHAEKLRVQHAVLTSQAFKRLAERVLGKTVLPTPAEFQEDELISHRLGGINARNAAHVQADTHGTHFDPAWVAAVAVAHAPPPEHGMHVRFSPPDRNAPPPPMADAKRIFDASVNDGTVVSKHIPSNSIYFLDARLAAHEVTPTKTNLPEAERRLNTTRAIHVAEGDPRTHAQKLSDFDAEVTATQQGAVAES